MKLKAVNNKEYSICEDTVATVAEKEKVREKVLIGSFGRKDYVRCLEDALYFQKHGRIAVNHGVCDYTIKGDVFYVVVLDNAKDRVIVNAYSKKIYELKDGKI
ncbi:MAG: hypothetical protein E7667_02040 [Ruminococcaceae bacterium]|nr:hypothetical protein [Oscillospiraceae bacterium]